MTIEELVRRQRKFYQTDKTKSLAFRRAALRKLRTAVMEREAEIAQAIRADLGKSSFESYLSETGMVLAELSYAERHLERWMRPRKVLTPLAQFPAVSTEWKEPYGVVLVMSPWNYPFMLCIEPLIGAIAAGNCCICKPSGYAPATSRLIAEILKGIYPSCYVAVVEGGREENKKLLEQRFDYIFFTGGVKVGRLVMEKASRNLTPVTLELGGKSPCIVDHTADLNLAAKRIVFGKFLNCGQTCVAPDYVLVEEAVREPFLQYLKKWTEKQFGENPLNNPDYGRIVNEKHFDRIMELIRQEKIYMGGNGSREQLRIAPTILYQVRPDSPVMQEEIFGPVLPVLTVKNRKEAEQFVREREKPLALYLFTRDPAAEQRILRNLSFGGGCVNDTIIHLATSRMGFGGVGQSGMGSYHGKYSFDTFSHRKSIVKKYNWLDLPIRYQPYTRWKEWLLKQCLK